ncbi:MAG: DUF3179 domain-containing protein [Acidobacteriota bacterium]
MTAGGPLPRRPLRRAGAAPVALLLLAAAPASPYAPLRSFLSSSALSGSGLSELAPDLVPGLVDALFFLPKTRRAEAVAALEAATGERPGERYHDWVELVARRTDLKPAPGYAAWKGELFARIDPRYREIFRPDAPARIRLEEIVWGGVPLEGIPALDRPASVPAGRASWMRDGERVFGVRLRGEARAYPLRIVGWHEMVNDVVGGEPVTLSYCTLCGSGVLFSAPRLTFGTSGLLYRSNKLMVDRQTGTLWSNLTGEPVLGRLALDPEPLRVLPLTLTTWKDWRARHPETTVLDLDPARAARWGYDYTPGAADRKREGVSFPAGPPAPGGLDGKAEVFAVRLGRFARAYEMEALLRERVVHDRLGEQDLVVVADPESGAARAYRSGGRTFVPGARPDELVDGSGARWVAGDESLAPAGPGTLAPLERIPGHQAFWFGWYAFFPDSALYRGKQ